MRAGAHHHAQAPMGVMYGVLAYSCWGLIPLFFKQLAHLPPVFVLGQRMLWACGFFLLLIGVQGDLGQWREVFRRPRTLGVLLVSASLVATNWGTFIYAVTVDRVLESSLGYFIAPLVNVALGAIVLRERFRRWQLVAILLAVGGVGVMTWSYGSLPWIGLVLAGTFGSYALFRKTISVRPVVGLGVETTMMVPVGLALCALSWGSMQANVMPVHDSIFFVLEGPVTAIPLILFTAAARRLRLATIGLLQYIGPIGQFLLAVFAYHEPFGRDKLVGFVLIWVALVMYSIDSVRAYRGAAREADEEQVEPIPE